MQMSFNDRFQAHAGCLSDPPIKRVCLFKKYVCLGVFTQSVLIQGLLDRICEQNCVGLFLVVCHGKCIVHMQLSPRKTFTVCCIQQPLIIASYINSSVSITQQCRWKECYNSRIPCPRVQPVQSVTQLWDVFARDSMVTVFPDLYSTIYSHYKVRGKRAVLHLMNGHHVDRA